MSRLNVFRREWLFSVPSHLTNVNGISLIIFSKTTADE